VKTRLFWILATILLAVVTHVSLVLFSARVSLPKRFETIMQGRVNTFQVLDGKALAALTRRPLKHMLYGGCLIVPGAGRVEMKTSIPDGYWSVSVYSEQGNVVYTLNDRHLGVDALTIVFQGKDKSQNGVIEAPRLRKGQLVVPLDAARVLAITQTYVAHPGAYRRKLRELKATTCTARAQKLERRTRSGR